MMFWNERAFGDLLELLGDGPNPYQPIVDNLEIALDDCRRASQQFADIPLDKGINGISNSTYLAINLLEEALAEAKQWRDAFDYHVKGGHGGHRSDF
jgi:hypothetical protein